MRILLDSNVLISAVATEGIAKAALATVIAAHQGFWSGQIRTEVRRILRDKLRVPPVALLNAVRFLEANLATAKLKGRPPEVCRDPKDNHVLHAALSIEAYAILTGDQDLLVIGHYEGIRIIRIREFLAESG